MSGGDWCIARYAINQDGSPHVFNHHVLPLGTPPHNLCGPLSWHEAASGGHRLGFPYGRIGDVARFASRAEAQVAIDSTDGPRAARDMPARLDALHFSCVAHNFYDGKSITVYDGGRHEEAVAARTALLARGERYITAWVDARPTTPAPAPP